MQPGKRDIGKEGVRVYRPLHGSQIALAVGLGVGIRRTGH